MIAAGARSRRVVVRGGAEAATGRMLAVAASWALLASSANGLAVNQILISISSVFGRSDRKKAREGVRWWAGGGGANVVETRSGQDASYAMGFWPVVE